MTEAEGKDEYIALAIATCVLLVVGMVCMLFYKRIRAACDSVCGHVCQRGPLDVHKHKPLLARTSYVEMEITVPEDTQRRLQTEPTKENATDPASLIAANIPDSPLDQPSVNIVCESVHDTNYNPASEPLNHTQHGTDSETVKNKDMNILSEYLHDVLNDTHDTNINTSCDPVYDVHGNGLKEPMGEMSSNIHNLSVHDANSNVFRKSAPGPGNDTAIEQPQNQDKNILNTEQDSNSNVTAKATASNSASSTSSNLSFTNNNLSFTNNNQGISNVTLKPSPKPRDYYGYRKF